MLAEKGQMLVETDTIFEVKNLRFKDILHLEHVSIKRGEPTVLLGESGSGKTTLLRMFNKLSSPDSGELCYNGQKLTSLDSVALRHEVVMLSQTPLVYPGTVRDNLLLGRKFSDQVEPTDAELKDMLRWLRLDKGLEESPQDFSGGEKQRLALARTLLMNPQVLLLDEPSSALDASTADEIIRAVFIYSKKKAITVVMVTHDQRLAEKYGEHIVTLHKGRVVEDQRHIPDTGEEAR